MRRIPGWAAIMVTLLPMGAVAQEAQFMTGGFGMACKAGQISDVAMTPRHDSCDFRIKIGRDDAAGSSA